MVKSGSASSHPDRTDSPSRQPLQTCPAASPPPKMTAPGAPTKEMYAAYEAAMQRRPSPDETVTLLPRHGSGTSVATAASTMNRAFLVTGFGLRNVDSLRRALLEEEEEKRRKRLATMRRWVWGLSGAKRGI